MKPTIQVDAIVPYVTVNPTNTRKNNMNTNTLEDAVADDSRILINEMMCPITYDAIIAATNGENFPFSCVDDDEVIAVMNAVNQGIDSRLQACYVPNVATLSKAVSGHLSLLRTALTGKKGKRSSSSPARWNVRSPLRVCPFSCEECLKRTPAIAWRQAS